MPEWSSDGMGSEDWLGNIGVDGVGSENGLGNIGTDGMGSENGQGNIGIDGMGSEDGLGNIGVAGVGSENGLDNVNVRNVNADIDLDMILEDLWTYNRPMVGFDDNGDGGVSAGSDDEDSKDSDYVEEGPNELDSHDVSSDEDGIFSNSFGGNRGQSGEGHGDVSHGGEGQHREVPSNVNDEDMREFDEAAPDLEDELMSLHGTDSEMDVPIIQYNLNHNTLALGMYYSDVKQFRKALRAMSIENGYPYKFRRSCTTVVHAICKVKGCKFNIRASKVRETSSFRVKSFRPDHTCPRNFDHRLVNVDYLTTKYLEDLRDDKDMNVNVIKSKLNREFGYEISLRKCYRAKTKGMNIICGEEKEQYRRLYDYAETVRVTNPGSMVKFKTELILEHGGAVPRERILFQYMYYRLAPQKQGFFAGLRPIVCLDGCHLKGMMGGQLLSAIGRDGNENMFPLAIAIFNSECKESWSWFLGLLQDDFGTVQETGWVFMSDQQKGLVEAFKNLMPNVEHRFCVKHMYENMKLRFKGIEYKDYL